MGLRTSEFCMFFTLATNFTVVDLELVRNRAISISQETKQKVIHLRVSQDTDQIIIGERINNRVLKWFGFVYGPTASQKFQTENEGFIVRIDFDPVNHQFVEVTVALFDWIADLSLSQNEKIVIIIDFSQKLLRMTNAHLNFFSKMIEGLVHKATEKGKLTENTFVAFFQVFFFHRCWKTFNECPLFFDVKLFADVDAFLYIVWDTPFKLSGKVVFFWQLFEGLEIFPLFKILRPDIADESSDPVDVVGKTHDAENLDENETESFFMVSCSEITKTNSEHDIDSPVIGPYVLWKPIRMGNSFDFVPVFSRIELRHCWEENGQNVGEAEVEENNLHQGPVLLIIVILDEAHFKLV